MTKPKVISLFKTDKYESRFLNISMLGKPVDLFLKCLSYDLKIPINEGQERILDIFEETILRIINLKKCTIKEMSNIICLPTDLINFILIRLEEKGYLKDFFTLTEEGINILNEQEKQRSSIKYKHGKLFMIKKTGIILPYIYLGEFISEDVIEINKSSITLGFGSEGNLKKVSGKYVRNTDYEKIESILPQRIIHKALKTYNKISTNKGGKTINYIEDYNIESSKSDNVYFHLQAVIQKGNVDELLFSDGFISNIDGIMSYIENENSQLLHEIKSRAITMKVGISEKGETIEYKSNKYSEIVCLYDSIKNSIEKEILNDTSIDELKEKNEIKRQAFINCYALLEWSFFYYTKKNRLSEKMYKFIKSQSTSSNQNTIIDIADSVGIKYTKQCKNLFSHVSNSKIDSVYNYNKPNLYICMPLAVLEASENTNSEMHALIKTNPSFLKFLNKLNSLANDLRHDSMKDIMDIDMDIKYVLAKSIRIVSILLPDLEVSESQTSYKSIENASNTRLLSQVTLEKSMGSIYYNTLCDNIKNEWQKISPDKFGKQLPDPYEYVQILSRLLEASLFEKLVDIKEKEKYSKSEAVNKLIERYNEKLPKSFIKVNENFYRSAVNNEKSTLGAYSLLYMTLIDNKTFDKLKQNKFVKLVDEIINLRGHANNIGLVVDEQKLNKLRDYTMIITKIIGGYYD